MLSIDDNRLLTQVGAGTPMGEVFRRYWIPALMSSEVPSPDCPQCVHGAAGAQDDQPVPHARAAHRRADGMNETRLSQAPSPRRKRSRKRV